MGLTRHQPEAACHISNNLSERRAAAGEHSLPRQSIQAGPWGRWRQQGKVSRQYTVIRNENSGVVVSGRETHVGRWGLLGRL